MQGPPFGYYEPPASQRGRPAVIMWFRVYAVATLLLYVSFVGLWVSLSSGGPGHRPGEALILLVVGMLMLVCGGFYAIAAMVPFKPWGWTVGLIAICLGLSSCMAVAAIPLLIFWMKPETKAAFGRL
mgnify:CR=1 FL=1